jgi:very-short-patch-repair endonuclease
MACQGKIRALCKNDNCEICNNASLKYILQQKQIQHLYLESNPPSHHVLPHSGTDINMKCATCPHEYPTIPSNITLGKRCPYCNKGKLCENVRTCEHCLPRCLISSKQPFFKEDYYVKENQPPIETITLHCNTRYKFKCSTCLHIIIQSPDGIFKGKWCNYCTGDALCPVDIDCEFCFKKSFASHPHSIHLSNPKEIENPKQYTLHSGQYTDFTCTDCNHSFNMRIADVSSGQWCPYCSWPTVKLCNQLPQCFHCYQRSIASHPLICYFDYENDNNIQIPEFICMFSNIHTLWLKCNRNHSFQITPTHLSQGRWCPDCRLKTEQKVYSWLCKIVLDLKRQFKPIWCKNPENNAQLSYDFNIESKKVIIEIDGNQHLIDIPLWKSLATDVIKRDKLKMDYAISNGYHIIRILQEDIWYDKYDWQSELLAKLLNLPEIPSRIFMCKNNEYDNHKL